jgi:hypothetical protein
MRRIDGIFTAYYAENRCIFTSTLRGNTLRGSTRNSNPCSGPCAISKAASKRVYTKSGGVQSAAHEVNQGYKNPGATALGRGFQVTDA